MVTYKKMLHGILEIQERGILHGNIQENLMKKNINSSKKTKQTKQTKTKNNATTIILIMCRVPSPKF